MKDKIGLAIVSLHISAVLYILLGIGGAVLMFVLPDMPTGLRLTMAAIWIIVSVGITAVVEVAVWGLKRRKFWAWILGLCLFGIYVPSLFLPLGALGLYGLLVAPSRRAFGVSKEGNA